MQLHVPKQTSGDKTHHRGCACTHACLIYADIFRCLRALRLCVSWFVSSCVSCSFAFAQFFYRADALKAVKGANMTRLKCGACPVIMAVCPPFLPFTLTRPRPTPSLPCALISGRLVAVDCVANASPKQPILTQDETVGALSD